MNENKFDKMMKSYCDRETVAFELKEKRNHIKYTSVLAATLVLAILATILIVPQASADNNFTLTVSAAEDVVDDGSGNDYDQTHLYIIMSNCENVKRITATSDSGNISFMFLKEELVSEEESGKTYKLVKHSDYREDDTGVYVCDVDGEEIHIDCIQSDRTGNIISDNSVNEYNDVIRYNVEFYDGTIKTQEIPVYLSDCDTPTYESSNWFVTQ